MERPPNAGQGEASSSQEAEEYDSPLFKSDEFRLWCMKVIPCTKRFVHDWTVCPFAHAGEKAVRRDPRLFSYTGIACPDMKKTGSCIRGEKCPYAHNVFEYWLHPTRYRTQLCNDGPMCRRGICFFAHSLEELRVPACKPYVSPEALARASLEAIQANPHPLGQELPNPMASAQQQAAIAAMNGRTSGMRHSASNGSMGWREGGGNGGGGMGWREGGGNGGGGMGWRDGGGSMNGGNGGRDGGLAASAIPFVPGNGGSLGGMGSMGGGRMGPSGEPARYSAPSGVQLLGASGSSQEFGGPGSTHGSNPHLPSMHSVGEYQGGAPPQQQYRALQAAQQQRWLAQQHQHQPQQQQQQHYVGSSPGDSYGGTPPEGGGPSSYGSRQAPQQSPQQSGGRAYYPSAPVRAASPAGGHHTFPSFAAVQQLPAHGFGGQAPQGYGSYNPAPEQARGPEQASGSVHSQRSSRGTSDEEEAARAASAAPGSGRASPAGDLASSLASLKIALTQQQLAAAAGSNHEVVITTLHQILKDAMAQQSGGAPGSSFGAGLPGPAEAAALLAQAGLAGKVGGWSHGGPGSPNAAHASFGSAPSTMSSLGGPGVVVLRPSLPLSPEGGGNGGGEAKGPSQGPSPPLASSPDAVACYQAAMLAAAAGYPGVMGGGGRATSPLGREADGLMAADAGQ